MFKDKTLMITGGTGSFGNAVLDRFLQTDIGEIRIFSRDEKKQDDMRNRLKNPKIKFYCIVVLYSIYNMAYPDSCFYIRNFFLLYFLKDIFFSGNYSSP